MLFADMFSFGLYARFKYAMRYCYGIVEHLIREEKKNSKKICNSKKQKRYYTIVGLFIIYHPHTQTHAQVRRRATKTVLFFRAHNLSLLVLLCIHLFKSIQPKQISVYQCNAQLTALQCIHTSIEYSAAGQKNSKYSKT